MKLIADISCFSTVQPPLHQVLQDSRIYLQRHRKYVNSYELPQKHENELPLAATVLYEVHQLKNAHFRRLNAGFLSIEYIQGGNLIVRKDDHCFVAEPGEIVLLQPYRDDEFMTGSAGYCVKTSLVIYGPLVPSILKVNGLCMIDDIPEVDTLRFEQLLHRFKELSASKAPDAPEQNELLCYEMFQFLRHPQPIRNVPQPIGKLYSYLEEHFSEEITVETMAQQCGFSKAYINQEFHRFFDTTPHQLLCQFRMRHAARLLQSRNELSIKEIAALSGYADPLNFSTAFKKHYDMSPRKYRFRTAYPFSPAQK